VNKPLPPFGVSFSDCEEDGTANYPAKVAFKKSIVEAAHLGVLAFSQKEGDLARLAIA